MKKAWRTTTDLEDDFDTTWDDQAEGTTPLSNVKQINLDRIVADEQTRKYFDQEQLQQLADNIKDHGQLQPCRVRYLTDRNAYQLITGERRFRACQLAHLPTLDCVVTDVDDATALVENVLENVQRQDLTPIEQARAYQQLKDAKGWGVVELAKKIQLNHATVSRSLKLLTLPADLQAKLESGELTPSEALRQPTSSVSPTPKRRRITREEKIATPKGTVIIKGRRLMTDDVLIEALTAALTFVNERQRLQHTQSDAA